ncbi:hypothetical protein F5Y19DRAFT_469852 [Xylariaceae sp. FL1651]|nr:hypothetical protein F5Y19DRAFT_469852 [Xylariaceae sp. FL1651]
MLAMVVVSIIVHSFAARQIIRPHGGNAVTNFVPAEYANDDRRAGHGRHSVVLTPLASFWNPEIYAARTRQAGSSRKNPSLVKELNKALRFQKSISVPIGGTGIIVPAPATRMSFTDLSKPNRCS